MGVAIPAEKNPVVKDAEILDAIWSWCPNCQSWFALDGPNGWFNHVLVSHPGSHHARAVEKMVDRRLLAIREAHERHQAWARRITQPLVDTASARVWGKYPPAGVPT